MVLTLSPRKRSKTLSQSSMTLSKGNELLSSLKVNRKDNLAGGIVDFAKGKQKADWPR